MSPQELLETQRRRSVQMRRLLYDGSADVPSIPHGYGTSTSSYYQSPNDTSDAAFLRSLGIAP